MEWNCKHFDELTAGELYTILQLRNAVFVVEQNCVYQDADNKDQQSYHLMCREGNLLIAYTRILPAGISYVESSIGRVVVLPGARKNGTGKRLMETSIEKLFNLFGRVPIKIGAQLYLKKFYESLGFQQCSDIYLEDGIQHIEMLLTQ
jgi:ElaA protein